jgi:Transglycosylase-like domain
MGKTIGIAALACALAGVALVGAQTRPAEAKSSAADAAALHAVLDDIVAYRRVTWRWQQLMGVPRTPFAGSRLEPDLAYRRSVRDLWRRRAQSVAKRAHRPPHASGWRCIHRYEASWSANTGNGYYGGLQMDLGFQHLYGAFLLRTKGTADRWSPLEQMWVAERAHRSGRGFWPWLNTARYCGLI